MAKQMPLRVGSIVKIKADTFKSRHSEQAIATVSPFFGKRLTVIEFYEGEKVTVAEINNYWFEDFEVEVVGKSDRIGVAIKANDDDDDHVVLGKNIFIEGRKIPLKEFMAYLKPIKKIYDLYKELEKAKAALPTTKLATFFDVDVDICEDFTDIRVGCKTYDTDDLEKLFKAFKLK